MADARWPCDISGARRVGPHVEINDIKLTFSLVDAQVLGDGNDLHTEFFARCLTPEEITVRSTENTDNDEGRLRIQAGFRLTGDDHEHDHDHDDPGDRVGLVAHFEVVYQLRETAPELAAEDLEAFADYNGVVNAWPYWRAHTQQMFAACRLDSTVVPVLQVPLRDNTAPTI